MSKELGRKKKEVLGRNKTVNIGRIKVEKKFGFKNKD